MSNCIGHTCTACVPALTVLDCEIHFTREIVFAIVLMEEKTGGMFHENDNFVCNRRSKRPDQLGQATGDGVITCFIWQSSLASDFDKEIYLGMINYLLLSLYT